MQAYHIDPVAKTINVVSLLGSPANLATMLNIDVRNLAGSALNEGPTPDVLFVADKVVKGLGSFFMINGLPVPVHGDAYIVGVHDALEGHDVGVGQGAETPTVSLEWVRSNLIWLRPAPDKSHEGMLAFEACDVSPATVANVLRGMQAMQEKGDVRVTGGMGPLDSVDPTEKVDLSDVIKAVTTHLH